MVAKQQTKIDAFGAIVELAFVNGQARCLGERLWQPVLVKKVIQIVTHSFAQYVKRWRMASESMNLRQRLHDKTGVVVVNKVTHAVHGIRPRAVGILIFQNEVQVSLADAPIIVVRK